MSKWKMGTSAIPIWFYVVPSAVAYSLVDRAPLIVINLDSLESEFGIRGRKDTSVGNSRNIFSR